MEIRLCDRGKMRIYIDNKLNLIQICCKFEKDNHGIIKTQHFKCSILN